MRSGPACEFKRTDGHEYWRYFLLEQRGEESYGRRGGFDGTTAGSELDVLIVQSNYPEGLEGVPVIVPARGAKWAFSEIYGRLAALQAAGAAPIIEAWLAGELPLTSFP